MYIRFIKVSSQDELTGSQLLSLSVSRKSGYFPNTRNIIGIVKCKGGVIIETVVRIIPSDDSRSDLTIGCNISVAETIL